MTEIVLLAVMTIGFALYVGAIAYAVHKDAEHKRKMRKRREEERRRESACGYWQ